MVILLRYGAGYRKWSYIFCLGLVFQICSGLQNCNRSLQKHPSGDRWHDGLQRWRSRQKICARTGNGTEMQGKQKKNALLLITQYWHTRQLVNNNKTIMAHIEDTASAADTDSIATADNSTIATATADDVAKRAMHTPSSTQTGPNK
jgi:hypothetical protein